MNGCDSCRWKGLPECGNYSDHSCYDPKEDPTTMKRYHFDLGNSTSGPIGFCAVVRAKTKDEAVKKLKKTLPEFLEIPGVFDADVEYLTVYFNDKHIGEHDIDEARTCEPDNFRLFSPTCQKCRLRPKCEGAPLKQKRGGKSL